MQASLQIGRYRFWAIVGLVCALLGRAADGDEPDHWAFQKPVRPAVPDAQSLEHGERVRNPIDAFVLARLEAEGLSPAPLADRQTLVRRAYFDLVGLPPTPEQIRAFVDNATPDAWSRLINELLASKQYGERWGRHWLDVARYADSGGYETDIYYRNAWRYRDYVVESFNADKPYDRFVEEQIAGDEIWPDNLDLDPKQVYVVSDEKRKHLEARIATGLYALGPQIHESGLDADKLRYERWTDWVDTTGSVFLGLTLGCARCHDHKFDPLSQRDYFAFQAIFAGSKQVELPLLTAMEVADWRQFYPRVLAVVEARRAYRLFEKEIAGRAATPEEEARKRELLQKIGEAVLALPERAGSAPNSPFDGLMEVPTATVLGHERPELVPTVHLLNRGELSRPEDVIEAALPEVLAEAVEGSETLLGPFGSRKQLAQWLTRDDHPLTARVMVNRIWQWHFGRGLVETSNDFGAMGQLPTHPKLLDWLALEFVEGGWSLKAMHRLILESSTYQTSSRYQPEKNVAEDPENRLLWRMNRRRLEAEALWDAVHASAGTLNLKQGGPPVVPPLSDDEIAALRERWHWPVSADPAEHTRRGMYILVRRNFRFPMFEAFDAPVTSVSCPVRDVTTVTPQALWGLNNPTVFRQAQAFAARVVKEAGHDRADWVNRIWAIALGRIASEQEREDALALMDELSREPPAAELDDPPAALAELPANVRASLAKLCLAVYNLNEFAFVD